MYRRACLYTRGGLEVLDLPWEVLSCPIAQSLASASH
jgi:hypothetical protein